MSSTPAMACWAVGHAASASASRPASTSAFKNARNSAWVTGWRRITPLAEHVSGRLRLALMVLAGAVGVVMLIVCANLSNLLLARTATRQKEIAIRTAMGAGRGRLLRQMLTDYTVGQLDGRLHLEGLRLGVELRLVRREHEVAADAAQHLAVVLERARIGVEIFVRRELQPVHEDARDDRSAALLGELDEREVARVQVAHGGHEGGVGGACEGQAQFGDGVDDAHAGCLLGE